MRVRSFVAVFVLLALLIPLPAQAAKRGMVPVRPDQKVNCRLPESDAVKIEIASNFSPGYWWDHTDLTVAVRAHPSTPPAHMDAIGDAIATWSEVLDDCFNGLITLTDVTGEGNNPQQEADIVLHYVPHAGGAVFAGMAVCGPNGCSNVLVGSDPPPGFGGEPYTPEELGWITLHELGHALGLGHASNLFESTDLMGYGWTRLGEPVLSDCDVDALAFVFAWAFAGEEPHPPAEGPYVCPQS